MPPVKIIPKQAPKLQTTAVKKPTAVLQQVNLILNSYSRHHLHIPYWNPEIIRLRMGSRNGRSPSLLHSRKTLTCFSLPLIRWEAEASTLLFVYWIQNSRLKYSTIFPILYSPQRDLSLRFFLREVILLHLFENYLLLPYIFVKKTRLSDRRMSLF
jgi:hypothetical protein